MPEREKLTIEIAMMLYAQHYEDLRKHEDRQTQAFNFALVVYGAELVTAGTAVSLAYQRHFPLEDVLTCVLPVFQIVFPALLFPLALLYLDVSIFNQVTHRMLKDHLHAVIDHVDTHLQPCKTGPDFLSASRVLKQRHHISLDRIWLTRHLLFLYAPFAGMAVTVLAYIVLGRFGHQRDLFYSREVNVAAGAGLFCSLLLFWFTVAGVQVAHRARTEDYPSENPKPMSLLSKILELPWRG
jgi:hypothetical protein